MYVEVEGLAHSSCQGVGEGAACDRGYTSRFGARQGACLGARMGKARVGGDAGVTWGRPNGRGVIARAGGVIWIYAGSTAVISLIAV